MSKTKPIRTKLINETEIDNYLDSGLHLTDEKVDILNDYYLLSEFLKRFTSKLTGKSVDSWTCASTKWYYGNKKEYDKIGARAFTTTDNIGVVEIKYGGRYYLRIDKDAKQCIYMTTNSQRRSLRVKDTTITLDIDWLGPIITNKVEEEENKKTEAKVARFQTELMIPWMHQAIIDNTGISESNIDSHSTYIDLKNFDRRAYYSTISLSPTNGSVASNEFEDRTWDMSIKGKVHIKDLKWDGVLAMLKALKDSGKFK